MMCLDQVETDNCEHVAYGLSVTRLQLLTEIIERFGTYLPSCLTDRGPRV